MSKADDALVALAVDAQSCRACDLWKRGTQPNRTEVVACHQWLEHELAVLRRDAVLVALGATAGQSVFRGRRAPPGRGDGWWTTTP